MDLAPSAQQALVGRGAELDGSVSRSSRSAASTIKVTCGAGAAPHERQRQGLARRWRRISNGLDRGAHVQEALQRIAATTACHAAVKANYPLTYEKMAHILDELRATAYSTVCPHGRPVMLRLTRREIEKNFDRI